jgi:hypothetical protein
MSKKLDEKHPQRTNKDNTSSSPKNKIRPFQEVSTYKNTKSPHKAPQTEPHKNLLTALCKKKPRGEGGRKDK